LVPGYWYKIPEKNGNGWSASLLVSKETLPLILGKKSDDLSKLLIRTDMKNGIPESMDILLRAIVDGVNESEMDQLRFLKISKLDSFAGVLEEQGLKEKYAAKLEGWIEAERAPAGIVMSYADGKLSIDFEKLGATPGSGMETAKEIEKIEGELASLVKTRAKKVSPEAQKSFDEIAKLESEKAGAKAEITKVEGEKASLGGSDDAMVIAEAQETINKDNDLKGRINTSPGRRDRAGQAAKAAAINELKQKFGTGDEGAARSKLDAEIREKESLIESLKNKVEEVNKQLKRCDDGLTELNKRIADIDGKIGELNSSAAIKKANQYAQYYDMEIEERIDNLKELFGKLAGK
jgi:predicted  nucleic acid-binding Zn-ribbon protein